MRACVSACGVCANLWAIKVSSCSCINTQQERHDIEHVNIVSDILFDFICYFSVGGVRAKRGSVRF